MTKSPPSEETKIPLTRVCSLCGNHVNREAKFCGACGKPIKGSQEEPIPLCPRCGLPMMLGFCMVCDKVIVKKEHPPSRICPYCGISIGDSDKYCRSCGKKTI